MADLAPRVLLLYASEIRSTVIDDFLRVPPLGLFYLRGALQARGWETHIIHVVPDHFAPVADDEEAVAYRAALRAEIQAFAPTTIGYSFRNLLHWGEPPTNLRRLVNFFSISVEEPIVRFVRGVSDAPMIGGGSGLSLAPRLYLDRLGLEYGVVGEGERVFPELVGRLAVGGDVADLPGLVFRVGGEIRVNPPEPIEDLRVSPGAEVGDFAGYRELYCRDGGYGSVQTKRGCPFRCVYCQYPHLEGRRFRLRDPARVVDEVVALQRDHDVPRVFFVDSVFNVPAAHARALCDELIGREVQVEWTAYVNPIGLDEPLLRRFREAGCAALTLTPDALSARTLESYRKGFTVEDCAAAVAALRAVGIPFDVSLILGGIGEDEDTVRETVAFCTEQLAGVPVSFFAGMWVHPTSPAYRVMQDEGLLPAGEPLDYDAVIAANDFETNARLRYYFPHVGRGRKVFLRRIAELVRGPGRTLVGDRFIPGGRVL
jgi:radical SAM superfamily enzyme YgiQ (UPF0313 family)